MISLKEITSCIDQVKDISVVVEGKRDVMALHYLGFSKVFELTDSPFAVVERIEEGVFQILTDFDSNGKQLAAKLQEAAQMSQKTIDFRLRKLLTQTDLSHMEGLPTFLKTLELESSE